MCTTGRRLIVAAAFLCVCNAPAFAAPINYGTYVADNFTFVSVTEDSNTDALPLFGAPTTSGDALVFSPTNFASSTTGPGSDITDGSVFTTIVANPGKVVSAVAMNEFGDYTLIGGGGYSTGASVGCAVNLQVQDVNGVPITPVTFQFNLAFSPSGGTYSLAEDGMGVAKQWNGTLLADLDAALAARGISGHATRVYMTIDNVLATYAAAGDTATIKKKSLYGVGITPIVPEPSVLCLIALGALSMILRRRAI